MLKPIPTNSKYLLGLTLLTAMTATVPARAALGGDAGSVDADAQRLHAQVADSVLAGVDARTITTGDLTVREYLTPAGTVFALSWSAVAPPDLGALLGGYFPQYSAALAALDHPGLRRSVRVQGADLVVEASGHLRAYYGRAWLPAQLPPGIDPEDLR